MTNNIYIAGPMTGFLENNYPAFFDAEKWINENLPEFTVFNPARALPSVDGNSTWEYWMRQGLNMMLQCGSICLLEGWERSRGANLESHVAEELSLERYQLTRTPDGIFTMTKWELLISKS